MDYTIPVQIIIMRSAFSVCSRVCARVCACVFVRVQGARQLSQGGHSRDTDRKQRGSFKKWRRRRRDVVLRLTDK
jgi:hypothetical protein